MEAQNATPQGPVAPSAASRVVGFWTYVGVSLLIFLSSLIGGYAVAFIVLSVLLLIGTIIGLAMPIFFSPVMGRGVTRKKIILVLGTSAVISLIVAIIGFATAPPAPEISIESPQDGETVTSDTITISGSVNPVDGKITINTTQESVAADGSFSRDVSLKEGKNTITIVANANGKETVVKMRVTRELTEEEQAAKQKEEEERAAAAEKEKEQQEAEAEKRRQEEEAERERLAKIKTFGDGTHRVGEDIEPGTYRAAGTGLFGCYFERLSGFGGNFDEIIANESTSNPTIVTIAASDVGFSASGCGEWTNDLTQITESKTSFGDGFFIVGTDIDPGTYRNSGGSSCYYERTSGFGHDFGDIITNEFTDSQSIVTISASDAGFKSNDCGTWEQI